MKDKKVEAAIKQLSVVLRPYLDDRKCSIVFSPNGNIDIGWLKSIHSLSFTTSKGKNRATDEQIATLTSLIRNPKLNQNLVDEYTAILQEDRLSKRVASDFISRCLNTIKNINIRRNPNLKPLE